MMQMQHSAARTNTPRPVALRKPASNAAATGQIFESLRQLDAERGLQLGTRRLRVGLACSVWQRYQAQQLLDRLGASIKRAPGQKALEDSTDHAVALALPIAPGARQSRAEGVVVVHRDGDAGLALDARYALALDGMRSEGMRLAEIERLAFDSLTNLDALVEAMVGSLRNAFNDWQSSIIVTECPLEDAPAYRRLLGFRKVCRSSDGTRCLLRIGTDALRVRRT